MDKWIALVLLPEMNATLGDGRIGLTSYGSLSRRTNSQGMAQPLRLLAAHQRTHLLGDLLLAHLGI